jgi:hypothetical protein
LHISKKSVNLAKKIIIMEQNQAINILVQVAHQALGAGLFKTFEDTKAVSDAINSFKAPAQQEEQVGLKKMDASNLK